MTTTEATEFNGDERRQINRDLAALALEAGAKLSALEDARTEMKGLRESVVVLAEAISHTATVEEIQTATRRFRLQIAMSITIGTIVASLLGWSLHSAGDERVRMARCNVVLHTTAQPVRVTDLPMECLPYAPRQ